MARKILLADDSVTAQNMGRKILTDAGYEVVTVNNGSAALKKVAETKPDLIVLDVYMPGYSGLEVCQRIKENRETARIPVLLTVGKLEPFKPEEARRARADAFVVKPFEASELLAALSKLEDKIIPQPEPYKQGRFAKAVASVEHDSDAAKFSDSDEGWKARLRIPVSPPKTKDSEAEPDYAATQGKGFRDFVEKPSPASPPKSASTSAEFDRPVPAGVPHDITPEEIAAIAAAAAQLSGAAAPVHEVPQDGPSHRAVDSVPDLAVAGRSEEAAPVTFANSPEVAAQQAKPLADTTHGGPADESVGFAHRVIPAEPAEVAPEPPTPTETIPDSSEPIGAQEPVAMQMAAAPEEEFKNEALPQTTSEAVPDAARETAAEEGVEAPEIETASELPPHVPEEPAAPVADDEVMAALQTLMPGPDGDAASASPLEHQGLTSLAADASNNPEHAGPRWIAEEVAMVGDEAVRSLEDEMNQASGIHHIEAVRMAVKAEDEPAVSAVSAVSADAGTSAPQTDDKPAVYAMASAAAGGETVAVPWTPSANVSAHENFAIETPPVHEEGVSEPEVGANQAPPVATDSDPNEIVGGTEVMAANWKNIRDSIAGAAAKPAPSKEHFQEPETVKSDPDAITPLASESARASLGATDPTAIANIVESVLAELRPKIVEEIARKLADPKKS